MRSCILLILLMATTVSLKAQMTLTKDFSFVMDIPSVKTIASSPAHFYALSETEGMAVFRSRPDSLQWLYSSTGMQRRGDKVIADIRFAYLFGDDNRLTVLEPTSVLGVYSSTNLPSQPLDVKRISTNLFIALGNRGLGELSLESPEAVDSTLTFVAEQELGNHAIINLEGTSDQLFALTDSNQLLQLNLEDEKLTLNRTLSLSEEVDNLFLIGQTLYGSNANGDIFEVEGDGNLSQLGNIAEEVTHIVKWEDWLVIRGVSNRLWTSYQNQQPQLWKENKEAGNYVAISKGQLWLSEYNQITKINASKAAKPSESVDSNIPNNSGTIALEEIQDFTVPHSKSLLFPIKLKGLQAGQNIQFTYQSPDIQQAELRGQSFYWEPSSDDVGSHRVTIIASAQNGQTATTSFDIHVRSYNAPPRFTPIRSISIPVGEEFSFPLNAVDPDGINKNLIRFLGVNLPSGASLNESTGMVRWTPTPRQTGENTFRVIATDQYGAASSVDVTINVVENVKRGNPGQ
ncbi:putative Ig domain-containing protein [Fodinibius salsisoli]|uniref:Ig domain-containing protein n=1 Tax=Fodinibius salsisoli TaxID=2820877 RepID=A0ABT3PPA5_9BACT|nr:putative Ig domain-containing protein [Fodinibius salsisoli]MCW9707695.1 putative Ig domain-containing protein [Fodinibius salsisoli]